MAGDPLLVDLENRRGITVAIMAGRTCDLYTGSFVNGIRNNKFECNSALQVVTT